MMSSKLNQTKAALFSLLTLLLYVQYGIKGWIKYVIMSLHSAIIVIGPHYHQSPQAFFSLDPDHSTYYNYIEALQPKSRQVFPSTT
jgi:hypothetical protein